MNDVQFLTVSRENPVTQANWNARLTSLPRPDIFQTSEWASVLQHTYGFTPAYFTATAGSRLISLLPIMEVNSWLTGRRGVSLPFTDFCEPKASSESTVQELFKAAVAHGKLRGWNYLESRGSGGLAKLFSGDLPSMAFYTHELDLLPGAEPIFQQFDTATRRTIRKAEKSNLSVGFSSSPAAIREYYTLHCQTRKQHGLPPQPFRFFDNIQRFILSRKLGTIVSAKFNGQTVASAVFFHFGTEAIYKFGASDKAFQSLRANNLVMWEAIKWFIKKGARVLHFGRTSLSNEGLRRFKRGWGTTEQQINYYKYDLRKSAFITDRDATTGRHTRVFQALPIFLSRIMGAAMYKHMA